MLIESFLLHQYFTAEGMTVSVDGCDMKEYKSLDKTRAGAIFSCDGGPEDLVAKRETLENRGFTRLESSSMKWAECGVGIYGDVYQSMRLLIYSLLLYCTSPCGDRLASHR